MSIAVIGMGNLGSVMAGLLAINAENVGVWDYQPEVITEINHRHSNQRYLTGHSLPHAVVAEPSLQALVNGSEMLFITLSARFINAVLSSVAIPANVSLVLMSKGFSDGTETAWQYLSRCFPNNPRAMLAGPSLANEMAVGVVTAMVVASESETLRSDVARALNSPQLSIQYSADPVGVELGGLLKNIYAMGLGLVIEQPLAALNFRAAFLTLALAEIKALGQALGAEGDSFNGLSGLGDLIATALSEDSHNRHFGRLLAQGQSVSEIETEMGVLPEGYNSMPQVLAWVEQFSLNLPLAALIAETVTGGVNSQDFMQRFSALLKP